MTDEPRVPEDPRRRLPSVDGVLGLAACSDLIARYGRAHVTGAIRDVLSDLREDGMSDTISSPEAVFERAASRVADLTRPRLRRVLNGTGVILHTNLGRARLDPETMAGLLEFAGGYSNLEYDLETGRRGDRYAHCVDRLRDLLGAEDALVVNNTAAAVVLVVNEFARGREVVVSRGELVEIGGGFRIPAMIERGGARLVEVGTTNRTRIDDYRAAAGDRTGLLLKIHPSNFRIDGFTDEASVAEVAALGRELGLPVAWDLGSAMPRPLLPPELAGPAPTADGADGERPDLVMWSGDKLLGGPQAGILHGRADLIDRLRGNPLLRAFRVDKLTLAVLEATLTTWFDEARTRERNPTVRALLEEPALVRRRAEQALELLDLPARRQVEVVETQALIGAGSVPGRRLPSAAWAVEGRAAVLDSACRASSPPLVGRIEAGRFLIDFRCFTVEEASEVAAVISAVLASTGEAGDAP